MDEKVESEIYLSKNEILDLIDYKFNYTFEGKDKNDHLISEETWRSYVKQFYDKKEDEGKDISIYYKKLRGGNKNRTYRLDFVEEIIEFRSVQLNNQYNSNRKTMIDYDWINLNKALMGWSDDEVPKSIYDKRVIITEYELRKENRFSEITDEDKEKVRGYFIDILIDDLIDMQKLKTDIEEWALNGELIYGYADPLEMIEDDEGPIGFRIDRKKYLKDSVIYEIKNS
ncbi:hypothetical protein [Massilibacterium senegalense]|uniref:hypothetical protein n=1 Tax=Massilibacterium senegalense TaxID=1632858 RepID=UPI000783250B|nr:hypothetical protein [Massilibacterium senegalense]